MKIKFPTENEFAERVAEQALEEYKYKGKTLKQWIDEVILYEAQKENNLIPCSKGMPKKKGKYIIQVNDPEDPFEIAEWEGDAFYGYVFYDYCCYNNVIAWMPLPEQYKPEQKTKDAQRQRDTEEFFTKYQEVKENE